MEPSKRTALATGRATSLSTPAVAVAGLAALALARLRARPAPPRPPAPVLQPLPHPAALRAARRLNTAAGVIAASVLADSAVEHYRGSFANKAMFTPLITASLSLAVSAHGRADNRRGPHGVRHAIYAVAGLTGLVGTAFHVYNVGKRTGRFSFQNLFYAAPIGAPAALSLSGALGFLSERVRTTPPDRAPTLLGLPAGRIVGLTTAAGLLGTLGEVGLMHFRGAFNSPAMYVPVVVPPVASALMAKAALGATGQRRPGTRWWLRATALMGYVGVAFHLRGIARQMGGWRNWSQNILNGPPVPAPPSFTGLAMAGLAALGLLEDHPDD